jgi:hypothetical protein
MNTNSLVNQKKYIDLDSTYRNRKLYKNPCDFVLDINAATRDTAPTALDPILLSFPYEANLTAALSTVTQIPLSVNASSIRNFYTGSYLEINGLFRLITFYDELTQIATVSPAFPAAYPALTNYTIRKAVPFEGPLTTGGLSPSATSIILNAASSPVDNFYVNFYVFLPGLTPPSSYQYSRILSYNGATKLATVAVPFTSAVPAGTTYEILEFTRDNVVPLRFNGNQVIGNPSPYEISLTNLIVPNRYVLNGYGGTLADYSHVYVSLYSANATTSTNAIFSNNNNSLQALFKVPISSLYLQANQQFYNFQFTNMNQTISFRENDSLHFTVSLPNGQVLAFEPINKDTYFQDYIGQFPIETDPLEQVTALFEIIKLPQSTVVAESGKSSEEFSVSQMSGGPTGIVRGGSSMISKSLNTPINLSGETVVQQTPIYTTTSAPRAQSVSQTTPISQVQQTTTKPRKEFGKNRQTRMYIPTNVSLIGDVEDDTDSENGHTYLD